MTIYIVQREEGEIPDEPMVFNNKTQSENKFMLLVGTLFKETYKDMDEAETAMSEKAEDVVYRYWVTKIR